MTEATTPVRRVSLSLKRLLALLISSLRRVAGGLFQLVARDQLSDLSRQAQRLGSASVESATYLGNELRALDARLARIEEELAELRKAIGPPGSASSESAPADEMTSGQRSS
jgi:hypothetical protein